MLPTFGLFVDVSRFYQANSKRGYNPPGNVNKLSFVRLVHNYLKKYWSMARELVAAGKT